jgi:membrane protein
VSVTTQTLRKASVGEMTSGRSGSVPEARTGRTPIRFLEQLGGDTVKDGITNIGAMMAYYAVLSLFPMLLFVITVAMLVVDTATVEEGLAMASTAMPESVATLLGQQVRSLMAAADAGFAIGGAALALWGASRGAASLGTALNAIFNKTETRSWLHRQAIAIGVTLAVAIIVLLALGLLVLGPTVGHLVADRFGLGHAFDVAWGIGRWVGAGVLVMVVWAITYKFLPNTDAPFRIFTPGAIVGVVLWLGISWLFGIYLSHFNKYEATYGALGTAIIFLTWLWLSNTALLFGAEVNDVLADFRKHRSEAAAKLAKRTQDGPASQASADDPRSPT